jgi:hypothetical protein
MMSFNSSGHVLDYRVHFERAFFMYTIFNRFVHDVQVDVRDTKSVFLVSLSVVAQALTTFPFQNL